MKYKAIIVEDELLLAEQLLKMITSFCEDISISGIATTGSKAEKMISALKPDLVFIDVELPDMNAFKLLEKFKNHTFDLIFTTAHDHYAIKAFDHNAIRKIISHFASEKMKSISGCSFQCKPEIG